MTAIYGGHAQEAERLLSAMDAARPGFPGAPVYRSLLESWRAFDDPGNPDRVARFRQVSDEAIRVANAWVQTHPNDAEAWRYLASSLGQRSQFAISVIPNTREIVAYGIKAREAVFRAYDLDRSDKDVLVGVGAANYFQASMPWFVRPVAFTMGVRGGDRELGLRQIKESMNEGPHSGVEAAMVLAAALFSENKYKEFFQLIAERITNPHPSLLPVANWAITGCICNGGMTEEARQTVQRASAPESWRHFQLGRIALANHMAADAESDFSKTIESGGNRTILAWAYFGRSLARTASKKAEGGDMRRAKETSPVAVQLSDTVFRKAGECKH